MMRTLELMFITGLVLLQVAVAKKRKPPDCQETCGNLTLDYPFGISDGCYLNEKTGGFKVTCEKDVPTLAGAAAAGSEQMSFTILKIRLPNQVLLETSKIMAVDCRYNESITAPPEIFAFNVSISLPEPFMVSARGNRFRAMGCDTVAHINNTDESFMSSCETQWILKGAGVKYGGLGQCQIAVPEGSAGYMYHVTNQFNYSMCACWRKCSYAFLADEEYSIDGSVLNNYVDEKKKEVNESIRFPLVGEWVIKDRKCVENKSPTCGKKAWCNYTFSNSGYNCYCNADFTGNPYLNTSAGCQKDENGPNSILPIALAGGFGLAATLAASSYGYGSWAEKKLVTKLASELVTELANSADANAPDVPVDPDDFNEIHDPTFDDPSPSDPGELEEGEEPREFKEQDLKKAIKVYQKGRRVALWARRRMVARAILANNQAVEIRKYTVQDRNQLENFVKGVRTLSRTLIQSNVARLLGISTRDSSLIYRYFSDKTLHDRLHSSRTDRPSWEERLKIAVGTARGLALAHSKGLYHGNLKSSNILLDERCNCKVVDFGVVRVWRRNKLLNSSKGYMDPEYLKQSINQLTSTMDVYSFGVVLVELITGQDPSAKAFNQRERSLALQFTLAVEKKQLQELVDNRIWAEERRAHLEAVADIATLCLQQEAKARPKMMVVRNELWKRAPELYPPTKANRGATTANPGVRAANRRARSRQVHVDNQQGQDDQDQDQFDSGFDTGENIQQESSTAVGGDIVALNED